MERELWLRQWLWRPSDWISFLSLPKKVIQEMLWHSASLHLVWLLKAAASAALPRSRSGQFLPLALHCLSVNRRNNVSFPCPCSVHAILSQRLDTNRSRSSRVPVFFGPSWQQLLLLQKQLALESPGFSSQRQWIFVLLLEVDFCSPMESVCS